MSPIYLEIINNDNNAAFLLSSSPFGMAVGSSGRLQPPSIRGGCSGAPLIAIAAIMAEDDDDDSTVIVAMVVTEKKMMKTGLEVFYSERRIKRAKRKTNIARFECHFGVSPVIASTVFEDLQLTRNPRARVHPNRVNVVYFLASLHFLKRYQTEGEQEGVWDRSPKTLRNWSWYYLRRIRALKTEKIV